MRNKSEWAKHQTRVSKRSDAMNSKFKKHKQMFVKYLFVCKICRTPHLEDGGLPSRRGRRKVHPRLEGRQAKAGLLRRESRGGDPRRREPWEPDTGQETITIASEASAGRAYLLFSPPAPDLQFLFKFFFYVKIAGTGDRPRSSSTESLILAQDERWRRA